MQPDPHLKKSDLLGSLGAGVLGAEIALYFEDWLKPFALEALVVGALARGWAMLEKHPLEKQEQFMQSQWAAFTYWLCWILLAALFMYIGFHYLFFRAYPSIGVAFLGLLQRQGKLDDACCSCRWQPRLHASIADHSFHAGGPVRYSPCHRAARRPTV